MPLFITLNISRFFLFTLLFVVQAGYAQNSHPDPRYRPVNVNNYVQSKNYYLLTLFQKLPDAGKILSEDAFLKTLAPARLNSLRYALKNCDQDVTCYTGSLKFSEQEISVIGERLRMLYKPDNALGRLVKDHLRPSGSYILYQSVSDEDMLVKAWIQDAEGVNYAIGVYAEGRKPKYPNIDSISFNTRDPRDNSKYLNNYISLVYNTTSLIVTETSAESSFFDIPLRAALGCIELNERGQSADYEPMDKGENKSACDRIATIRWDTYKYSLIMIPGAGPEEPSVPLSAEGMIRCRLAALQYQKGMAPFIVTSGGKVHPYKTKYCEALEMKRYLIEKLHIPVNAILIDPHARHTTTNMRNTVRMIYRYGIPFDKAAITCTTKGQSMMIEKTLITRCQNELNETPYKNGSRLSETEMEFYPLIGALQINPLEPIDP